MMYNEYHNEVNQEILNFDAILVEFVYLEEYFSIIESDRTTNATYLHGPVRLQ